MSRIVTIAGAQMGPIARSETRTQVVRRLLDMMRQAKARGADVVVFPELALTTFFSRWWMDKQDEIDAFFEREMPGPETRALFDAARDLEIGFYLGYAELVEQDGRPRHFNTSLLVGPDGKVIGKYRKVHLPGHVENRPHFPYQHLEKRYFEVGDIGFPVWKAFGGTVGMGICNDRRWPEVYRLLALQGAELMLLGYNTPTHIPWTPIYDHLTDFHSQLCVQAGAYQNSMWVAAVAKAGTEEGETLLGGSLIVAPSGEVVARAITSEDEVIVARCDLDISRHNREEMFNFALHRRVEYYGLIAQQTGIKPVDETSAG